MVSLRTEKTLDNNPEDTKSKATANKNVTKLIEIIHLKSLCL